MNTHDGEDVDAEDFQKEAPKSSPVPAAEMEVEAENRPVEMSNSDTESDQQEEDTNLPPRGRFPKLSFQDLEIHFKKSRSKRRHKGVATHTKELRRTRKSNKRFRELPERSYPKAPLKLSKVSTGEAFSEWISWAKKVFKRQKLERTKRLGPRDLGYHDNMSEKPSTPPGGKKMNRPKSELDFTPKLPDPIDDRKLPDWEKAKPPKLNRGVLDLPQDSIYAVLNTWGFIRAFRYPLGINEVIGEGVDMKLEDFVRCFSNTEDDLSLVGTIFSSIAALSLDAGTLDPKKDVLLDDGKRSWMAVNMLTWQWHVSNYLENLEEKRITAMAGDEEDDGGKDDLKNGIMSNSTPRELQYYSKERDALSNDMAYTLPFQSKIRLLALLIDKALCSSKTLHKHLDEGISLMRECSIRHRKQKTLKKQKNQKSVSAECASVYADIVAQVVRSQASSSKKKKETKEQLATAKAELVRKAEKYIDDLEMEKEGKRQKEVAALMAKYPLRATTLMGKDRWLRRYYVFGNHASKEASAIYVFDPAAETTTTTTTTTTNQCWGAYETKEQFDRLLKFLSPCGMRESHLLKGLKEHNWKWPPKAQKKAKSQLDSKSKSSPVTPARQKARKRTGKTPGRYKVAGDVEESTTTTTTNSNNPGKIRSPATTAKKEEEEDTDTATTTTAKPAVDGKSAFSSPSSLAKINSPPITSMRAAAAAATAKLQNGTKAMEDDYDDSEDEIDSPYITKKLTRNMKREELSSNFKPPDINAPLQSDPKEKEYFAKMIQAKKGLIASQLLFRLDGCYLPVCYVCQETLGEDEWHCPYTHRTFKKSEYTKEEFAVLLDEGKREFESGDIIDYNKVSHPLKILKALLMDVEATIPEESTREASKRDINKKREKWIDRVKYALDFTDLATALMQLQGSLRDRWLRPWFKSAEWREAVKKVSTESELAALLYAFDRAILYTPKFKDVCEAEKDKDGKVKTSCEEFPTPNTFPKHQIEFNISAGSDHGPDFRELYGDPRTRINHIHSKATIIFRKNKHVVILGGREASQDDEDDEPAASAPPSTDSATTGDNKMDIDEKKAKVVTAAMSVKTRDLLKHFLELKRKRLEKEEKKERRAPGRSRYGVANPIVRYHGPCPPTYQPEDMEDPDPADETDEDDDEDDDDDGAADDDDDEQHDNHEENAPENPDKDAKSTDNADNGMEVEEDGDGKGGNANGK